MAGYDDEYGFYDDYHNYDVYKLEDQFANLSDSQWNTIENYSFQEQKCMLDFWSTPYPDGKAEVL